MDNWIIPCNVKFFNIVERFNNVNNVIWKRDSSLKTDDIVYLYLGAPYSQIKYKCIVVKDSIDEKLLEENKYAIRAGDSKKFNPKRYMMIEIIKEYADNEFPYKILKEHGLGQVQKQARTDRKLQSFIDSVDN